MKNSQFITLIATMVVLTILGVLANDYLNKQFVYKQYGSAENYEKVGLVNALNYDMQLGTLEEVRKEIEEYRKNIEESKTGEGEGNGLYGAEQNSNTVSSTTLSQEDLTTRYIPIVGDENAKFSIYEFTDYECPWCQKLFQAGTIEDILANVEDINLVRRNFQVIHLPGAPMKAQAAFCAMEQKGSEAYLEMLEKVIYAGDLSITRDDVLAMGESQLGLDKAALEECINSGKYKENLNADENLGRKMGVTGTPSLYIVNNETGKFVSLDSRSIDGVKNAIETLK